MIKSTGIIRPIDENGRLVLPKEIRRLMDIGDGVDSLEVFMNEGREIVLRKYQPACIFCDELLDLVTYKERPVCVKCIKELKKLEKTAK